MRCSETGRRRRLHRRSGNDSDRRFKLEMRGTDDAGRHRPGAVESRSARLRYRHDNATTMLASVRAARGAQLRRIITANCLIDCLISA